MAKLVIEIPDDYFQKVVDSFASQYGYTAALQAMPQWQTPEQFCASQINGFVFAVTAQQQSSIAASVATQVIQEQLNKSLVITAKVYTPGNASPIDV